MVVIQDWIGWIKMELLNGCKITDLLELLNGCNTRLSIMDWGKSY